jgi:DNA excision repair protein ERCC-4
MTQLKLPALRGLGTLADHGPVIVIDTREQDPLAFGRLQSIRGTLMTGDYSVCGLEHLFAVERKSIADLVGCCMGENRERFERELHRLRGFRFKRLLIVGTEDEILKGDYRSNIKPQAVMATLRAFEIRYDTPVVFCDTAEAAAQRIESWAFWFSRETVEAVNGLWRSFKQPVTDSP